MFAERVAFAESAKAIAEVFLRPGAAFIPLSLSPSRYCTTAFAALRTRFAWGSRVFGDCFVPKVVGGAPPSFRPSCA
jgi:hypothetical protein